MSCGCSFESYLSRLNNNVVNNSKTFCLFQGVVPATIGIINGKIHVGLNNEQLETLSKADSAKTMKCSRRDISFILSQGLNGGTTVSGTMLIAHAAGIPIMATGGIGGVHRGAELTLDISADLIELGRTPVAVVCSGVKSILDIGKTLEYLVDILEDLIDMNM